jgi:hypothetical protein
MRQNILGSDSAARRISGRIGELWCDACVQQITIIAVVSARAHFLIATVVCHRFNQGPVREAWLRWLAAARVGDPRARELAREAVRIVDQMSSQSDDFGVATADSSKAKSRDR